MHTYMLDQNSLSIRERLLPALLLYQTVERSDFLNMSHLPFHMYQVSMLHLYTAALSVFRLFQDKSAELLSESILHCQFHQISDKLPAVHKWLFPD